MADLVFRDLQFTCNRCGEIVTIPVTGKQRHLRAVGGTITIVLHADEAAVTAHVCEQPPRK
jgi:predicted ester cyclase